LSEKKQVILVKDLVIKADNVIIERGKRPHRDPIFGFPRGEFEKGHQPYDHDHD